MKFLDSFITNYEDNVSGSPDLINDMMVYDCDELDCKNTALVEWVAKDKDGIYYTYRCIDHPVKSPEYQASVI